MACIETISTPWRKVRSVNQTSAAFVDKLATLTEPAGDAGTAIGSSILEVGRNTSITQNGLALLPYATGSDGDTFSLRVFGWAPGPYPNSNGQFTWFPQLLCEVLCTISSSNPGVANGYVVATELFAKTITATHGNENIDFSIASAATAALNAALLVDIRGHQKIEVTFKVESGATGCNALGRFL